MYQNDHSPVTSVGSFCDPVWAPQPPEPCHSCMAIAPSPGLATEAAGLPPGPGLNQSMPRRQPGGRSKGQVRYAPADAIQSAQSISGAA